MWVWNLAALMLRSRKSWLRMVPMAVALLIMTVSLGVNRSINLSPEQSVTSTLGAADGLVSPGFSVLAGSSSPTVPINRWKVRQINPYLETQVSVKGLPEEVLYQESSMPGINTKGRYALISGKWPTKPSEIVVTPSLRQGIGGKNKLVLEPGNYDLTIVGTVGATFDKSSREILARSGTWQAWPLTQKQAKISGLSGNYLIFFTSSDSAGTCSKVNDDLGSDPLDSDACTTREQLLSKEFAPLSGKKIVEQYLAWFLVAGLGAGLAAAAATTSARRIIAPLTAMGVPRRKLALSLRVVTLFMSMATAAASLVTGELLVIAIRPLLARFSDNPLSPVSSPTMSAVTCLGAAIVTAVVMVTPSSQRERKVHGKRINVKMARLLAWSGAIVACALLVWASVAAKASLISVAIVSALSSLAAGLVTPWLLALVSGRDVSPGRRLAASRALRSRGSWHGLFAGLTAGLVAATATGLLIVASLFAQMNATSSTGIPHGMAYFLAEPGFSPSLPGNLVKQFDDDLHGARKVPMTYGSSDDRAGNSVAWWAFHNVDDVASIFPLTDRQRRQLQTAGSLRVTTDEQASSTEITVPRDLGWLGQIKVIGHGYTPPAKSSDSSVSRGFLYVGLSPNQEDTAYHWATTHHIDPSYVMAPRMAPKVPLPAATLVATGLFTMMTVIMAGSLARDERLAQRRLTAHLRRLGLTPRWVDGVIFFEVAMTCVVAVIAGTIGSLLALLATSRIMSGTMDLVHSGWWVLAALAGSVMVGSTLGATIHRPYSWNTTISD